MLIELCIKINARSKLLNISSREIRYIPTLPYFFAYLSNYQPIMHLRNLTNKSLLSGFVKISAT